MKLQELNENIVDTVGRKLKVKTTKGKPNIKDAPKWAKFIGQTPQGAYHWLDSDTPVEGDKSNKYFPKANKTEFTGFMGSTGKGSVTKIKEI